MMHGYLFTTVLLLLPIVLIGRRWSVPIGLPTVLVAVPALAMHLMFLSDEKWWLSLTVAAAAAGVELVVRVVGPLLWTSSSVSWLLLGLAGPPLVWGTLFLVADIEIGVSWNVHIVTGLLTYVSLTGAATVLVARNVRPSAPAVAPAFSPSSKAAGSVSATEAAAPDGTAP
jgi:hypothetical protein